MYFDRSFLRNHVTLSLTAPFVRSFMSQLTLVVFFLVISFILYFSCGSIFFHLFASSPIVTITSVWSLTYFTNAMYILFISTAILYLLPNLAFFTEAHSTSQFSLFSSTEGVDLIKLLSSPVVLLLLVHTAWSGPTLTAWFGHILFSYFQYKVTFILFFFLFSYICALASSVHYSSTLVYDYTVVFLNFFVWLWLVFFSNNAFTFIFFLELLSALITLLLVTSTFSSTHFYNLADYSSHSYFQTSTPTSFVQTLLVFFWVTLVASLSLFIFLIFFYLQFLTFDWNLTDCLFSFLVTSSSLKGLFTLSFSWLLLLLCIFIKCGVVPFYLWKPAFFKGMSILSLFFYIYVYYFSIFLYFVYVMYFYFNEIFLFNLYIMSMLVLIGTVSLAPLLFESFYIKAFLALSSILNSLLIFYGLCSLQATDTYFTFLI